MGFWVSPGALYGKETNCQCRRCKRCGFNPWVRKIPWRRAWQPTPGFLPGEPHRQRSLEGYTKSQKVGHDWSDSTASLGVEFCASPGGFSDLPFFLQGSFWKFYPPFSKPNSEEGREASPWAEALRGGPLTQAGCTPSMGCMQGTWPQAQVWRVSSCGPPIPSVHGPSSFKTQEEASHVFIPKCKDPLSVSGLYNHLAHTMYSTQSNQVLMWRTHWKRPRTLISDWNRKEI